MFRYEHKEIGETIEDREKNGKTELKICLYRE